MLEIIIIIVFVILVIRSGRKRQAQGNPEKTERDRRRRHLEKNKKIRDFEKSKSAARARINPENAQTDDGLSEEIKARQAKSGRYSAPRSDLRSGIRYEEWQTVPNGKTVCRCGYCAADNLIPTGDDRKKYRCYFCHVQL